MMRKVLISTGITAHPKRNARSNAGNGWIDCGYCQKRLHNLQAATIAFLSFDSANYLLFTYFLFSESAEPVVSVSPSDVPESHAAVPVDIQPGATAESAAAPSLLSPTSKATASIPSSPSRKASRSKIKLCSFLICN